MELHTQIVTRDHTTFLTDGACLVEGDSCLEHDAIAAHALLHAIKEHQGRSWLEDRAAELMQEWTR